ncbi:uncharacterized protein LOC115929672 isoform X1 [Strongylocentrotus purpuratus]|uniref:Uncharacterized protein n=1 Tax=Strongylocentrotus purpuratus TaxID=7668 RepID=A0A7M7PVZ0_STRPU|nr:uncharacterized protein LOC115929672 isoform X1 [Strongylocentrotus purpuratus]
MYILVGYMTLGQRSKYDLVPLHPGKKNCMRAHAHVLMQLQRTSAISCPFVWISCRGVPTLHDPATPTSIIQNSINSTKDPFDIDPINLQNTVDPNDPIDLNIQKYGRCRSCTTTS